MTLLIAPDRLDQLLTPAQNLLVTAETVALGHERNQPMLLRRQGHLVAPGGVLAEQTLFEGVVQPACAAHVQLFG